MNDSSTSTDPPPTPENDWICQRQVAELISISERTASVRATAGHLRRFEHGFPACGRRKYSRALVLRELEQRWQQAIRQQEEMSQGPENAR